MIHPLPTPAGMALVAAMSDASKFGGIPQKLHATDFCKRIQWLMSIFPNRRKMLVVSRIKCAKEINDLWDRWDLQPSFLAPTSNTTPSSGESFFPHVTRLKIPHLPPSQFIHGVPIKTVGSMPAVAKKLSHNRGKKLQPTYGRHQ